MDFTLPYWNGLKDFSDMDPEKLTSYCAGFPLQTSTASAPREPPPLQKKCQLTRWRNGLRDIAKKKAREMAGESDLRSPPRPKKHVAPDPLDEGERQRMSRIVAEARHAARAHPDAVDVEFIAQPRGAPKTIARKKRGVRHLESSRRTHR